MPKVDFKKMVTEKMSRLRRMKLPRIKKPKVYFRWLSLLFRGSWVKVSAVVVTIFLILYYSVGGWMVQNIDTTTDYEIRTADDQSATVEVMSFLINREIRDNMWTPNLPFIFPSYFLDNMPNFQLGIFSALKTTSAALAARLDKTVAQKNDMPLKSAAEYLSYPGTVWMFSPTNKLVPAPSAGSQYRKARRQLLEYNQLLRDGSVFFYKSSADLAYFLQRIADDLWKSGAVLEAQVRENSSSWIDTKVDDIFYFQKGKVYAYYLLIKALGHDYKDIVVECDVYRPLTNILKTLEDAALLSPAVVRNGETDSSTAPNSLMTSGYYTLKAASVGKTVVEKLKSCAAGEQ